MDRVCVSRYSKHRSDLIVLTQIQLKGSEWEEMSHSNATLLRANNNTVTCILLIFPMIHFRLKPDEQTTIATIASAAAVECLAWLSLTPFCKLCISKRVANDTPLAS